MPRLLPAAVPAAALVVFAVALPACSPASTPARASQNAVTVSMQIADPGKIFSTYDLRSDPEAEAAARQQGVSESQWQDIVRLANESEWPTGLQDVSGRVRLRDEIRRLRTTRVATFRDKVILYVPSEQPGLPAAVQGRAFYIVVGESGTTLVGR